MPWCLGTSGSVRASSMPRSAYWPPEVHTFWPLTIHSSPSLTALVWRPARSDPACGLAEELAPGLLPGHDVAHVQVDLLLGAVRGDGRSGQQQPESGGGAQRTERSDLLLDQHHVGPGHALAVGVGRKPGSGPAREPQPLPPLGDGEVGVPVVAQPGPELARSARPWQRSRSRCRSRPEDTGRALNPATRPERGRRAAVGRPDRPGPRRRRLQVTSEGTPNRSW